MKVLFYTNIVCIRPSSEIVTTCHGMNLEMLPISIVAIPNFQFQLELATLATGNIHADDCHGLDVVLADDLRQLL